MSGDEVSDMIDNVKETLWFLLVLVSWREKKRNIRTKTFGLASEKRSHSC